MHEQAPARESPEYAEVLSEIFSAYVELSVNRLAADRELGITPALADCLQFVYLHGICSVRRIAEGLSITEPAASQLVDRLVRGGLLTRTEDEHDRRLTRVWLTEKGLEAASRNRTARQESFARVLSRLDQQTRKALVSSLEGFLTAALGDAEEIEKFCKHCGIDHVAYCVLNRAHQAVTGVQMEEY